MALVKFDRGVYRTGKLTSTPAYGQIEPNQVWFNRAGMIEAQCYLDTECFSDRKVGPDVKYVAAAGTTPATKIVAQNGAFLMIDKANKLATIPTTANSAYGFPMGINYSTEKLYDERTPQRRNFCLTTKDWLPRIGYTQVGMRITTNTVQWDTTATDVGTAADNNLVDWSTYTDSTQSYELWQALKTYIESGAKVPVYAVVLNGSDGELVLGGNTANALGNVYAQLVKVYTNADRTCSFEFQIINKP